MDIIELRRKRAKLLADARALNDLVTGEDRSMTDEEQANWEQMMADADELRTTIEREERLAAAERELGEVEESGTERRNDPEQQPGDDERSGRRGRRAAENPQASDEYRAAFENYLRRGATGLTPEDVRALEFGTDAAGGYLSAPLALLNDLLQEVDDMTYIRQFATTHQLPMGFKSLGVPVLEADPADATWTTELETGTEDTEMAFGRRTMTTNPIAKRIKISHTLLRRSPNVEALVRSRLAYKFSVTHEKAFMTGSGTNEPLGLFTADANGIPASRDVSEDNTATAITADGMISAKYALKQAYWASARWMFHPTAVKRLAKLKDADGQYLWRESVRAGEPDRLVGLPVYMSEFIPATFTTGLYVGILGDFRHYWILDSLDFQLQRLNELYAETNQVGLIGRWESDGQPVMPEAFVRVKLG